ncbi:hypothetical protein HPB52_000212 [Rhipicephalus sanguineus]|uniref:Uncharacterized protein n=1 Tax=Rhipicephalus sanguineus TaxID=34632 RepID=A0A9D4QF23_RHISA|nr:hypothetical protein HPB52_000212 [Rhipicephalus sanguineus]
MLSTPESLERRGQLGERQRRIGIGHRATPRHRGPALLVRASSRFLHSRGPSRLGVFPPVPGSWEHDAPRLFTLTESGWVGHTDRRTKAYHIVVCVVSIGSRVVTPDSRNLSQTGHFLCDYHDEDRVLEISHADYFAIKYAKNALRPLNGGSKDGKRCNRCKSTAVVHTHCRKLIEWRAPIRVPSAKCKSPLDLYKFTDPWNCHVLPSAICEIRTDTNVVHVSESNEHMFTEKPMDFSYVILPHFINDLDLTGIMITDEPLKSSRDRRLSWLSIRRRRHLESETDKLQHLIPSHFLLGSGNISLP